MCDLFSMSKRLTSRTEMEITNHDPLDDVVTGWLSGQKDDGFLIRGLVNG